MKNNSLSIDEITSTIFGFFICCFAAIAFLLCLSWAHDKEVELGISGRSSESLLLEYEKGEK